MDTATSIWELDPSLPLLNAPAGEGDDEIRKVKSCIKYSLPGNDGTIDWMTQPEWNEAVADRYDDATPQVIGPRALNSLPSVIRTIGQAINDLAMQIGLINVSIGGVSTIPNGLISLWSGAVNTIPANWYLCDGTNGTPNLRNRFVVGAGDAYAVAAVGGAPPKTVGGATPATIGVVETANGGVHSHTGKTGATAITVAQLPPHGHPFAHVTSAQTTAQGAAAGGILTGPGPSVIEPANTGAASTTSGQQIGASTGAGTGETHDHTIPEQAAHKHTVDVRPAFYALAYIMFKTPPAPTVATPIPDQTHTVGMSVTLNIASNFTGGLIYSAAPLPTGISFSSAGVFSGTLTKAQAITVTVTAANGGGQVQDTFQWTVNPA